MRPLTTCCSSTARLALLDVGHGGARARGELVEEALRAAERRRAHPAEKEVVHAPDLRHDARDAPPPGAGQAEQRAARVVRVAPLREQAARDEPARLGGDEG